MFLYRILNTISPSIYIGITIGTLHKRFGEHKRAAIIGTKTPLYNSMRSKGIDKFYIELIQEFSKLKELQNAEYCLIKELRDKGEVTVYNILDGGQSYFNIVDKEAWKAKLRIKRVGRTPALGMKHSEDNKKLFGEYGKLRWDLYRRYPKEVINYSFKNANLKFGISKTHYYRLLKQSKNEE